MNSLTIAARESEIFSLLKRTLEQHCPTELRAEPTDNFFAADAQQLKAFFGAAFAHCNQSPVLVFSDGVKKLSGCQPPVLDDFIFDLLSLINVSIVPISLSDVLGCAPSDVHASVDAVELLKKKLTGSSPTAVLVVGSGSVTDVVKHALFELEWSDVPLIVLPTALTVTAFTSHFAVLEEAGAKRTRLSRRVDHCVWFAPVLASAPIAMTRAGYGDLLARCVAYGDWFLSWRLGVAERYDELAFRLMEPFAQPFRQRAADMKKWPVSLSAIEDLSAILAMAGVAMSLSGETTPLSGFEHTISHALDFIRLTSRRPLCWHGEQVALACLSSAESFDQLLSLTDLHWPQGPAVTEERIRRTLRQLLLQAPYFGDEEALLSADERKKRMESLQTGLAQAESIFSVDYLKKHRAWESAQPRLSDFASQWPDICHHLRTLVMPAGDVRHLLEESGLPLIPEELSQPTTAQEYRWAVRFSPFVRSRASLADVIFWLGEDPAVWALT
jgi:glycerol-1-phosphate dehydrogenase [NAD(P)+]